MKVTITQRRKRAASFGDLSVGDFFTTDDGGLFIKVVRRWSIEETRAAVIEPIDGGAPRGSLSNWNDVGIVIPVEVTEITAEREGE